MTRVGVLGAGGRMGQVACRAIAGDADLELVAAIDPRISASDLQPLVDAVGADVRVGASVEDLGPSRADVAVDFTVAGAAVEHMRWCADHGVHAVVGTTGIAESTMAELAERFEESNANCIVAPNFAIGAVLMMRFAVEAATHIAGAEIIELHHEAKLDAPSGTAKRTAELIAGATGGPPPPIHSVRLPGLVAHQEVILGDVGQTLVIRHDSLNRESFMPGVLLAVRRVKDLERPLTVGLEQLLF
jgi:4-hydroxy-tetrahydrodipicolinate reductase